ncbi:glycosyltransferase family 2 protein [Williamwhitmania taraxaci]|uniref:Glycosyltransferase involved in cell wall bisynthesis n=1 Tax=Williamwhitmania taraxaci TaxID=1640674 RepID=A0A1G6QAN8_9BACT|nr:glycosyltransferase [Williamwhitmania taraxaci]SDC88737.1 Glycosyltransferase involved in cell wall bisynthesis [Williamwhitmania taraxaci]
MLSVLIPVYQYDVTDLVSSLINQLAAHDIVYEILVFDDCSVPAFKATNSGLKNVMHVKYVELEQNIGRSKIRNLLASTARFENLLFLDCDVSLPETNFIERYLNFSAKSYVTVGGICYRSQKPTYAPKVLRWKYGHQRETQIASQRNKQPYSSFKTANFFITRTNFLRVKFSEEIHGYGHEDTLFGYELEQVNIPIFHIDNPVYHDGLEDASVFISKSEEAVKNLYMLFQSGLLANTWKQNPLLRFFVAFRTFRIHYLLAIVYLLFGALIRISMQGRFPFVFLFNTYKLLYISYISVFCKKAIKE